MNFASVGVFGAQFLLTFMFIESSAITYGNYTYPVWSDALCSMMSLSVIVWIPVFAIYYLCTEPGDIMQVAKDLSASFSVLSLYRMAQKVGPILVAISYARARHRHSRRFRLSVTRWY